MLMSPLNKLFILFFALMLTACHWSNFPLLYKPDIQQGNILKPEQVQGLHLGINQDEVNYLLGTPVLINILDPQTTQYVYTFKSQKTALQKKELLLTFKNDRLVKIDSSNK